MDYSIQEFSFTGTRHLRLVPGLNYGLLFTIIGISDFQMNSEVYDISSEEILICKPGTSCVLNCRGKSTSLLWLLLPPSLMDQISTEKTHIRIGFEVAPYRTAVIRPGSKNLMLMKNLLRQMMSIKKERDSYCADLLEESSVKMFSALILRSCASQDKFVHQKGSTFSVDEVFRFIHSHITEDLSLERLEKEFYVSRSFLSKEFKRATGQTVHKYIVKVRLDICKKYLEQGYSAIEVHCKAGFCSYNHFFRAFKQEYGLTPKEYLNSFSKQKPK